MATESRVGRPQNRTQFQDKFLQQLNRLGILDFFGQQLKNRLSGMVKLSTTPEFEERTAALIKEGHVPIVASAHFTHLDPGPYSHLTQQMIEQARLVGYADNLHRFVAPIALSVPLGRQGIFLERMYRPIREYSAERGLELKSVTRAADEQRYDGMKRTKSELGNFLEELEAGGTGVLVLMGGSVQPGRHKGAGRDNIFGLQRIKDGHLAATIRVMLAKGRGAGREAFVIPAGIDGVWRGLNSDKLRPTKRGVASLFIPIFRPLFGTYMHVRADNPITMEDLASNLGKEWRRNPDTVNDFVMTRVALLVPPYARGDYSDLAQSAA